jgi:hypothetical protein
MFSFGSALVLAHSAAGRYEETLHRAEEALRENTGISALRV